ncbi:ABC transporter family protein [Rhynchospora pubera]|uniref:ABC transporter family protein n=1 Tax=Rhynchospora pubera TaxID=906938 RepID=A0AAV8G729_9POAL|nr:ABC transporter family protein [Rhynchospora pubera]
MHADTVDVIFMVFGFIGAVGDGLSTPLLLVLISHFFNEIGNGPNAVVQFTAKINMIARNLLFLALGSLVMGFLEGYFWARTAERQASTMRATYLKAVLRQDVEYFDLKVGSTNEVIASVSSDSLIIQDVLSEKDIHGNFTKDQARPQEYHKAGIIVEQAISSVRTVYSFVAEEQTMTKFSKTLEFSVKLGLKQGLAKGLAIGSNGITFTIYAFEVWYGSHLVIYHGATGGTVYAVAAAAVLGGLALGSALSNIKYLAEGGSAGVRILEVIQRVPKIDSESTEGEVLQNVSGEVEFKSIEFAYPSRLENPIFVNFNLRVPAGRTVALAGSSGSGKSTVIRREARYYWMELT